MNALEPIEAWVGWSHGQHRFRLGRVAQDFGGRRLVARNYYRNTTNTYTGVDYRTRRGDTTLHAFLWSPDDRRPRTGNRLRDDDFELDEPDPERRLAGLFTTTQLSPDSRLEAYVFHLNEGDDRETPTANRRITTPGFRWLYGPPQGVDLELEVAMQLGQVRASRNIADRRDLDHRAALVHAEAGWRRAASSPRFSLALDYASGDPDAADGKSNTFDALFGAVVPDFGPSGIWTWLNRRNQIAMSAVIDAPSSDRLRLYGALRYARLAQDQDAWFQAGLRDPTGDSGRPIATLLESRLRYWLVPRRLLLDTGIAAMFKGEFARTVPGNPGGDRVVYNWLGLRWVLR